MKRSFIREVLQNTTNKTISFAGGLPDEKLFSNMKLKQSAMNVMDDSISLQYLTSTGLDCLKEKIAQIYCDEGFITSKDNIMITSGSQQAEFYNNISSNNEIRFNFTHCTENEISKGLHIIKEILGESNARIC